MANASETYQATLPRPAGLPKERMRLAAALGGAALLIVAVALIEPLRTAALHAFGALYLFSALVAG